MAAALDESVDTVVFDLGGVLLGWEPAALFGPELADEVALERFLRETDFEEWNLKHDGGVDWTVATRDIRRRHPEHADLFSQYPARFAETLTGDIPGSIEILGQLRSQGIRLFALTNFARSNYEIAAGLFPWLKWFDGIVISSHEGIVKPDARIYRTLMRRFDVVPTRSIFVDDRIQNVQAAQELGFDTIHFSDAKALREELVSRGVLRLG